MRIKCIANISTKSVMMVGTRRKANIQRMHQQSNQAENHESQGL